MATTAVAVAVLPRTGAATAVASRSIAEGDVMGQGGWDGTGCEAWEEERCRQGWSGRVMAGRGETGGTGHGGTGRGGARRGGTGRDMSVQAACLPKQAVVGVVGRAERAKIDWTGHGRTRRERRDGISSILGRSRQGNGR